MSVLQFLYTNIHVHVQMGLKYSRDLHTLENLRVTCSATLTTSLTLGVPEK